MAARDHPDLRRALGDGGDQIPGDILISRGRGFILRRKIDPKLHHLKFTAPGRDVRRVIFLVQDAASGGHPLHITRPDDAPRAGGIAMLDLAVRNEGHRLKALMGMSADAARGTGLWAKVMRPGVIKQQKGAGRRSAALRRRRLRRGKPSPTQWGRFSLW